MRARNINHARTRFLGTRETGRTGKTGGYFIRSLVIGHCYKYLLIERINRTKIACTCGNVRSFLLLKNYYARWGKDANIFTL